ncbi:MAG: TetR/AcrR family transcriptional regulator [Nitrospirota bacterium]|nr:TetR/AcrR family transcriptional regulator [Nitrospirota bacterium]
MNRRSGIESKKRILDAAMVVFSRQGYAKANIREIAKVAGISVGGVYLYFKNKEELYLSFIKDGMNDMMRKTEMIVESHRSPIRALYDFLKVHINSAIKHRELILVHVRELGFTFALEHKRQYMRNQLRLVEKIIDRGIRTGEFRRCNVKEVAKIIMGTVRSVMLSMAMDKDVIVTTKGLHDLILNGLLRNNNQLADNRR